MNSVESVNKSSETGRMVENKAQNLCSAVEFSVPLLPPSVNHYKKPARWTKRGRNGGGSGGYFVTKEALAFIEAVCIFSARRAVIGRLFAIRIDYQIPRAKFLRWDLDNFSKVSCDALTAAGVIPDDRYISRLYLAKHPVETQQGACTAYSIEGLNP